MPNKTLISNFNAIEENDSLTYNKCSIFKIFLNLSSDLAEPLLIKLPNLPGKNNLHSASRYYSSFMIPDDFCLNNKEKVFKIISNIKSSKATGVDKIFGRFLKDGINILAKPISAFSNLSIKKKS